MNNLAPTIICAFASGQCGACASTLVNLNSGRKMQSVERFSSRDTEHHRLCVGAGPLLSTSTDPSVAGRHGNRWWRGV